VVKTLSNESTISQSFPESGWDGQSPFFIDIVAVLTQKHMFYKLLNHETPEGRRST
jgi:hypothetical protein